MKKLTLMLTIVMIASAIGGGLSSVAFAENVGIETSDVLFDLQNSQIAGENFNPDDYGYTAERSPKLLAFAEYGFAFNKSDSDYNIYLYVYNPSGREIKAQRNSVSIATVYENGKAVDYDKFALKLLSGADGKYARLFYKFKVKDPTKLFTRVSANTNVRRYDVSEIELNFGDVNSEAFDVGNYYEYSGYSQGFGADSKAESTLACTTDSIETLELEVKSTYYRYKNGVNKQSDLTSVYFGIPCEMRIKYGKLQQIKANWFETKTSQQLVFTDKGLYNGLYPYLGYSTKTVPISLNTFTTSDGKNPQYLFGGESKVISTDGSASYSFAFDGSFHSDTDSKALGNTGNRVDKWANQLDWLFYSNNGNVSSTEVLNEAKNYSNKVGGDLLIDKYSKSLFVNEVDEGRQYGWQGMDGSGIVIDADSKFDIDGFTTGSAFLDWWKTLFNKDLETNPLSNIEPIKIVEDKDVLGTNATIAERLYIAESEVSEFLKIYNQNKLEGKETIIFRFAVTDYTTHKLYIDTGKISFNRISEVGYVSQQTVFLDFDIIWLKFIKAGQSTVIPCVSSPIDVFHGLTPPLEPGNNLWAIIVAVVVVVLLLFLIFKLLGVVFRKRANK